jgi:rfaE bifunctional protein kinase chain/domain
MSEKMKFLVIGDVMLDRYTWVETSRKAPEASIPVWDTLEEKMNLGGAANVAANIKALGGSEVDVFLAGIVGSSAEANDLLNQFQINRKYCPSGGSPMIKHRFVENVSGTDSIIFRNDNFKKFASDDVKHLESMVRLADLSSFDVVVFSDYDKGSINWQLVYFVKHYCTKSGAKLVVDSKRTDVSIFSGFDVLKVNEKEMSVLPKKFVLEDFAAVVETLGSRGAFLHQKNKEIEYFPTSPREAVDVTGCGDTHTAAMAFALAKAKDLRWAIKFANVAAGNVVQKFGTSVVDPKSLQSQK